MPVAQVVIQVKGVKKVRKTIGTVRRRFPNTLDKASEFLAKEIQRRARISFSQQFNKRTGIASDSIRAEPLSRKNPYTWSVTAGKGGAEHYILRLEEARPIKDWAFIPRPGAGFWGEGYASPRAGRQIPIRKKGMFMKSSFDSVRKSADQIVENRISNMLKRSGV